MLRSLVKAGLAALALLTPLVFAGCEPPPTVPPPQPPPVATVAPTATASAAPADPAPVTDGDVTVAYTNGIQIVVKRTPGVEVAALQLCIKGGVRDWTSADAGIGQLALAVAVAGGTATLDKDAFTRKLSALGSDLWAEPGVDYEAIKAKTLVSQLDPTFDLLADAFLHAAVPATEVDVQRSRQLSALRREQDDPDQALSLLVYNHIFKNHPFVNRPIGTEASVKALTTESLQLYLAKLREAQRLVLVVVGDVDAAHVVDKVKGAFGSLPRGDYQASPFAPLQFDKPAVQVLTRKLATNYIAGAFAAPSWTSPDFPDAMVAMNLLSYRLFEEVRTKRNLSYAPSARFHSSSSVGRGQLYVTAVDPNATIKVMLDEVKKLQSEPVPEADLTATKSVFLTRYLMENESTSGQAGVLANAILLGGDWKLARTLPERIRAVTPAGVQAFAKKHLARLQFTVLGDPEKIDRTLFTSL